MKKLNNLIMNIVYTFSILSLLFGVLCKANILKELPYSQVVFPLFSMSVGTTLFITVRGIIIQDSSKIKSLIDVLGCSIVIFLVGHFVGWVEITISYILLILSMVLIVYLLVWIAVWLKSKSDEKDLNRLLSKQINDQNK